MSEDVQNRAISQSAANDVDGDAVRPRAFALRGFSGKASCESKYQREAGADPNVPQNVISGKRIPLGIDKL